MHCRDLGQSPANRGRPQQSQTQTSREHSAGMEGGTRRQGSTLLWARAWEMRPGSPQALSPCPTLFLLGLRFSTCQTCIFEVPDRALGSGLRCWSPVTSVTTLPSPQLPLRPPLSRDCRDLLQRLLERDPSRRISFQDFFAHPWVDLEHMPSGESLARAVSRPTGMWWDEGMRGGLTCPLWW